MCATMSCCICHVELDLMLNSLSCCTTCRVDITVIVIFSDVCYYVILLSSICVVLCDITVMSLLNFCDLLKA